ncbi:MAG: class I SAM-dependent methyltransferase, partial [Nocardioides sp.]|nr:class I SAM-dependent methyltransferase [Nocardioides sp.]
AETEELRVGSALDAGCGTGAEAIWLAQRGWQVMGADISRAALASAAARAEAAGLTDRVEWVQADLTAWSPGRTWDLVTTHYAHAETGQLAFYRHISSWVAPGGTLLIVGHLHSQPAGGPSSHHDADHDGGPSGHRDHPEHATATTVSITGLFAGPHWQVESCHENTRTVAPGGVRVELNDVVVRLRRT